MTTDALPTSSSVLPRLRAWALRLTGLDGAREAAAPIESRAIDPKNIGRGFADPRQGGKSRIVVTVDEGLFERLRQDALATKKPLAAIIRERIEEAYAFRRRR